MFSEPLRSEGDGSDIAEELRVLSEAYEEYQRVSAFLSHAACLMNNEPMEMTPQIAEGHWHCCHALQARGNEIRERLGELFALETREA